MEGSPQPGRAVRLARGLERIDPRIKLLTCLLFGLLALATGPAGLAGLGLVLAPILVLLSLHRPLNRAMTLSYLTFVLIWMVLKMGLDLWAGAPWEAAALEAGLLGLRLSVLLLLGLALALSTSPRSLGLALAGLLRPVLGRGSWRIALALALFVHFLPLTWHSLNQVKTAFAIRSLKPPWMRRLILFTQAVLRHWSQKAWKQTLALASRGLDDPRAWQVRIEIKPAQWAWAGAVNAVAAWYLLFPGGG